AAAGSKVGKGHAITAAHPDINLMYYPGEAERRQPAFQCLFIGKRFIYTCRWRTQYAMQSDCTCFIRHKCLGVSCHQFRQEREPDFSAGSLKAVALDVLSNERERNRHRGEKLCGVTGRSIQSVIAGIWATCRRAFVCV